MEIRLSGWETALRSRECAKRARTARQPSSPGAATAATELGVASHSNMDVGSDNLGASASAAHASASLGLQQVESGNMDTNADHPLSDVELADDERSISCNGSSRTSSSRRFLNSSGGIGDACTDLECATAEGDVQMSIFGGSGSSSAADDGSPTLPGTGVSTAAATADVTPVPISAPPSLCDPPTKES